MNYKELLEATQAATGRKYQHVEDLVFTNGSLGGLHAVERLRSMIEEKNTLELKWDGCIDGDTLLLTNKGDVPIKEVVWLNRLGEDIKVFGRNLNGSIPIDEMTEVSATAMSTGTKAWIEIEFANGGLLRCTVDHQIFTTNRGWVKAGELTLDDDVQEM